MKPKQWMLWGGMILFVLGIGGGITFTPAVRAEDTGLNAPSQATTTDNNTSTKNPNLGRRKIMGASLLIGRSLYAFEELGSNGKSCKNCHRQGADTKGQPWKRKEGDTYMNGKMSLAKAINACITSQQGGSALQASGAEMKSLVLYVNTLQK